VFGSRALPGPAGFKGWMDNRRGGERQEGKRQLREHGNGKQRYGRGLGREMRRRGRGRRDLAPNGHF